MIVRIDYDFFHDQIFITSKLIYVATSWLRCYVASSVHSPRLNENLLDSSEQHLRQNIMISDLTGSKLTLQGNYILVYEAQRIGIEKIISQIGVRASWSPSSSVTEPYSDWINDTDSTAVWNVRFEVADVGKIQAALDAAS